MVKPWLTNGQRDRPVGDDNQALEFRWGATSACQYFSDTAGETYQFSVGYLNPGRPDSRWQPRIQVQWMAADNRIIGQHDGRRGWALHGTYDKKELVHTGPIVKEVIRSGGQLRVIFDSMGSGLASRDGQPLTWFELAGADQVYAAATATIDDDSVVVAAPGIALPQWVRFAWHETAEPNLMNVEGIPANSFVVKVVDAPRAP